MPRKDKARHHVGTHTRFFTKLRRTVTLALYNGRNRRVVGIDQFAMQKLLATYQSSRLLGDTRMVVPGLLKLPPQALTLARAQIRGLLQELVGTLGQGHNWLTHFKEVSLSLPHQLHKHATLATALATKAPHDLAEVSLKGSGLCPQHGFALGALLGALLDDLEDFFFAL